MAEKKRKALSAERVQLIAKALADPRRYEILKYLGEGEQTQTMACSLVRECMAISPATLSHHMKELQVAGLVKPVREGKFVSYLLRREELEAYLDRVRRDLI
jgi:ArsR family transcriptional regulator